MERLFVCIFVCSINIWEINEFYLQIIEIKKIEIIVVKNFKLMSKVQKVPRCPLGVFICHLSNHLTPVMPVP